MAEDALYYRGVLHKLIDLGTDIAREVHQQAKKAASKPAASKPKEDPTIAFERIARTIRLTIILAQAVKVPPKIQSEPARPAVRTTARKQVIRAVEDAIQRETERPERERVKAEFHERLETIDGEDDLKDRPVAEVIQDICRDLGVEPMLGTHPLPRRTPADLATLHRPPAKPPRLFPRQTLAPGGRLLAPVRPFKRTSRQR